ncbi:peptidase S1 domain-containing protein [Caerostris extrusa]|uniref:Peptidase S1 domain-containing protein n=1 Tax=Caerostris extrusa TaxID=172846 RepID=A0AAV4U2G2_CAEEX|nr:peptidase S1 domain-containing protein [Caerostris extrusa]
MKEVDVRECQDPKGECARNMSTIICAKGTHENQSPCKGDCGASVFSDSGPAYFALGVTSPDEKEKCQPSRPIAYTRVYAYLPWIRKHVGKLPTPQTELGDLDRLEFDGYEYYEN